MAYCSRNEGALEVQAITGGQTGTTGRTDPMRMVRSKEHASSQKGCEKDPTW